MFKKMFSILAAFSAALSCISSAAFAEGCHVSTRLAKSTSLTLQTVISQPLPVEIRGQIIKIIEKLKPKGFDASRVESREIQDDLSDVIQKIESEKPGIYAKILKDLNKLIKELKKEEAKEYILVTYPHVPSELREIKLDLDMPDGKSAVIRPDGHFIGSDGEEILVCFNDNLSKLREIIFNALKRYYSNHSARLWAWQHYFFDTAKGTDPYKEATVGSRAFGMLKGAISSPLMWYNIFASDTDEIIDKTKFLSSECAWLNKWISEFGTNVGKSQTPCIVSFHKDLSQSGIARIEDPFYSTLESSLYDLSVNKSNLKDRVHGFDKLLNNCLKRYTPDVSIENAVAFAFPLTRIDNYLRRIENDGLDDKDPDTVFAVRTLREKINVLSLRYKFASLNEQVPLLNVRIGRCKIVLETDNKKIIFIDRTQAKAFIKEVEKKLDVQASNITRNHDFQPMTGAQLRDLVRTLNPESYQSIIDDLSSEIIDMQAQKKSYQAQSVASCSKVALEVAATATGKVDLVKMLLPSDNAGEDQKSSFTADEVKEYIDVDKQLQSSAETRSVEMDVIEFMRTTNPTADSKCIAVSELSPVEKQNPKVDTGFEEKIIISKREVAENMTRLGQALKRANLKPKDIDDLLIGFHHFIESQRIGEHIKLRKNQREYIKKLKDYESDFINLFKLYIQLYRLDLKDRVDYYGILIEEIKNETKDGRGKTMREYSVSEVKNLGDIAYGV